MSKAMFAIAAAVALNLSPAWAGDGQSDEKAAGDTAASAQTKSESTGKSGGNKVAARSAVHSHGGTGSSAAVQEPSPQQRESDAERWLREREGYRDGGY